MHKRVSVIAATAVLLASLGAPAIALGQVDMRFVYGAPGANKPSPDLIDQVLEPGGGNGENPGGGNPGGGTPGGENPGGNPGQPTEVSRIVEEESAACEDGLVGEKSRTREVITYSDGSTAIGNWSSWDISACLPAPATVISTETQTENAECDVGQYGQKVRTREVSNWSDGTQTIAEWSAWSSAACISKTVQKSKQTYEARSCENGLYGSSTKTFWIYKYSDGTESVHSGPWQNLYCKPLANVGDKTEEHIYTACPAGKAGTVGQIRTLTRTASGVSSGAWNHFTDCVAW